MSNKIKKYTNSIKAGFNKNGSSILTGLGIAGMLTSTGFAIYGTIKAVNILQEEQAYREERGEYEKLTKEEIFKLVWKQYIVSGITAGASIACLVGANKMNNKKITALTTAYKLSEDMFSNYKREVIKNIGAEAEEKIRHDVNKKHLEERPIKDKEVIFTGKGDTLFYDSLSGRYFRSDVNSIKESQNLFNHEIICENYCSLNNWYYHIGLDAIYPLGSDLGWNSEWGVMEVSFDSSIADNNEPCIVIDYNIKPRALV